MAATLRAPVRAALASSSRARIVTRHSSRCPRAVSGSSAGGAPSNVEVITFDLDDTLWPTTPVVMAANKAFVDFCQERIPGFPDCAGINEYMKAIRTEREARSKKLGERHVPLSFAALRIAAGFRAACELGVPEPDAVGIASRGYHIAWIPTRGASAREHLFDDVVSTLHTLRTTYPNACIGTITNGLGSAAGAGLGDYFDFEISADAMMDEMMIHEDDARKPAAFPFTLAGKMAREMRDWSGTPGSWVHVGDDVVNDCEAAKTHGPFKTVLVAHPGVVPWGQPRVDPARAVNSTSGTDEVESSELVDVRVTSVGEIPGAIAGLYAS